MTNFTQRSLGRAAGTRLFVLLVLCALAADPLCAGQPAAQSARGVPAAGRRETPGRSRVSSRMAPDKASSRAPLVDRDLRAEQKPGGASIGVRASASDPLATQRLRLALARLTDPSAMRRHGTIAPEDGTVVAGLAPGAAGPAAPQRSVQIDQTGRGDAGGSGSGDAGFPEGPGGPTQNVNPWSDPGLLADPNHSSDQYVSLAVCPGSDNLYAVFEAYDLASTDRDIHIARSTDGGVSWTVWEMPSFSEDEYMPDIAVDGLGYLHVVWARADGVIVRARSAATDDPRSWAWVRGLSTGVLCATPSVAVSGSGDFARVFIACSMADYGEWTLLWMWSTNGGSTLSYDYLPADGYPDLWPDVAINGATAYMVNGEQDAYTGEIEILIAADDISGTFASVTNLTDWTSMSCGFPALAAQGQQVYCVYQLDYDDGMGSIDGDIMYSFSWDGLATIYGPYALASDPRENVGPAVYTRDGVVGTLFMDAPNGGDEFRLLARQAGGQGHPDNWLDTETVNDQSMVEPSFRSVAGTIGRGHLHAAWSDRRDYPTQGLNIYKSRRLALPNLAPYTPAGWSGPLVASLERGGRTTGLLAAGDTTWVSLAIWNNGLAPVTAQSVTFRLTLDGAVVGAWLLSGGLPLATYAVVEDYPIIVGAGAHDLALVLDATGAVEEELETDNTWVENLWFTSGTPLLALRPDRISHTFPAAKAAADRLAASPPLVRETWLPVVSERLQAALAAAPAGAILSVIVVPAERVDAAAAAARLGDLSRADRRAALTGAFVAQAERAREALASAHRDLIGRGQMSEPKALWLPGVLAARMSAEAVAIVAADPAVARLWIDDQTSAPFGGSTQAGSPAQAAVLAGSPGFAAPLARRPAPPSPLVPIATRPSEAARAADPAGVVPGGKALAWHLGKIGAPTAWSQGLTGAGVLVGHLDSGVNYNHPDFAGRLWDGGAAYPNHGYDFLDEDADPMDGDTQYWHGTHTAGLIVGGGAGGTTTGAAPGARLMALRCVPGYYQDMVDALQFALEHGAAVISFSAGWADPSADLRAAIRGTAASLLAAGVPWICAAGNGDNAGGHLSLPRDVASPGDCPSPSYGGAGHTAVIAVGATDASDVVSSTSSRGPTAWSLTSPPEYGDYPYPPGLIKPDVAAPGVAVTSTVGPSGYAAYSGTSMAAPLVAAAAAILLQARPALTPAQIADALEGGAVDIAPAGRDVNAGAGRIDVPAAISRLPDTAAEVFWIRNDGPLPLRITGMTWSTAWLSIAPTQATLAPGDSARFTATFDPAGLAPGTHYDEAVIASNAPGSPHRLFVSVRLGADGVTGLGDGQPPRPAGPALAAQPNPFNPRTLLRFASPAAGRVRLEIVDLAGRRVRTLVAGDLPAGEHAVAWDGRDDRGRSLPSGLYLARLSGPGAAQASRKLTLAR